MNTELLERIADHIEAMPESWDLSQWAWPADERDLCDTVGCVAGWAVMLTDDELRRKVLHSPWEMEGFDWESSATKLLELDEGDAHILFSSGRWWGTQMKAGGFEPTDGCRFVECEGGGWYVHLDAVPAKAAAEILRALASGVIRIDHRLADDD